LLPGKFPIDLMALNKAIIAAELQTFATFSEKCLNYKYVISFFKAVFGNRLLSPWAVGP
jgi:hypothetical protein